MPNPAQEMPDTMKLLVDRSPELLRNAVPPDMSLTPLIGRTQTYHAMVSPFEGEPGNPDQCPLAVAIGRLFDVIEMHIEGEKPWFKTRNGQRHMLNITADVALWIGRFDRHEPVMPFEMRLETTV